MTDRPSIGIDEFRKLLEKENKPQALDEDRLLEYSVSALNTLRGLTRSDKIKVLRRMRKMLDA